MRCTRETHLPNRRLLTLRCPNATASSGKWNPSLCEAKPWAKMTTESDLTSRTRPTSLHWVVGLTNEMAVSPGCMGDGGAGTCCVLTEADLTTFLGVADPAAPGGWWT